MLRLAQTKSLCYECVYLFFGFTIKRHGRSRNSTRVFIFKLLRMPLNKLNIAHLCAVSFSEFTSDDTRIAAVAILVSRPDVIKEFT